MEVSNLCTVGGEGRERRGGEGEEGRGLSHVSYVQCKQYGFFAGEILPPHLPCFLL